MDMLTVTLDFPRNILGVLNIPERQIGNRFRELIALELVREGRISSGKGAEMSGMTKADFINLMARNGISCFTETPGELGDQVGMMESLLKPEAV
ncbi:MAG: UPF0175 family protein [Deltaproteobacteria bacterium]|nr:MAG: UPF0175 family protein [Deltaproteobacteria bacterium]